MTTINIMIIMIIMMMLLYIGRSENITNSKVCKSGIHGTDLTDSQNIEQILKSKVEPGARRSDKILTNTERKRRIEYQQHVTDLTPRSMHNEVTKYRTNIERIMKEILAW